MTELINLAVARQLFHQYGEASELLLHPMRPATTPAGPAIYICDVPSGRVLVLETAPTALQQLSERAGLNESRYEQIRAAFSVLFEDLFANPQLVEPDTRRGVILGAAFCISETRGFSITKHHGHGVQHLLVRYPDAQKKRSVLTPMPIFKTHPLPATELESTVNHILLSEQLNYPERFTSQVSLRFRQLRRNILSGK